MSTPEQGRTHRVKFECGHVATIWDEEYGDGSAWCQGCGDFRCYEGCNCSAGGTNSPEIHDAWCALADAPRYEDARLASEDAREPDPWPIIDWLAKNMPRALELCPYKVSRDTPQAALPDPPDWAATRAALVRALNGDTISGDEAWAILNRWDELAEGVSALARAEQERSDFRAELIIAKNHRDWWQHRAEAAEEQVASLREALEEIATVGNVWASQKARAALSPSGEAE